MTINTDYDLDLSEMLPEVTKVRDCVRGSYFVKRRGDKYLPNPNQVDKNSTAAKDTYEAYKKGAEFDEYTEQTQESMLGKLDLDNFTPELPDQLEQLINDTDGDGLSLKGLTESCVRNVLGVKWHILTVDYVGLQNIPAEEVTIADAQKNNPRPVIKQYVRESVVKADFKTINGAYQLSFIMFKEEQEILNQSTYKKQKIESYLILALDEEGNYYQQKIITENEAGGGTEEGKKIPVIVNGQNLKFIPLEIVCDDEIVSSLPQPTGFLTRIANMCLDRYRVSADYKQALQKFVPTTNVYGIDDDALETFQKVNGRSYYASGQVNVWPTADVKVETTSTDGSLDSFEKYFETSKDKIRSLGGVIPESEQANVTATEARINAAEQNSVLVPLVNSIERSIKMVIAYCAMFQGLTQSDNVDEYAMGIIFDIPKDFTNASPDAESAKSIQLLYTSGLYTKKQAVEALVRAGWQQGEVDVILSELDDEAPDIEV